MSASDVRCQPIHDGIAPFCGLNPGADVLPDLPIKVDQRSIDGLEGALPHDINESHDDVEAVIRSCDLRGLGAPGRFSGNRLARHAAPSTCVNPAHDFADCGRTIPSPYVPDRLSGEGPI